MRGSTHPTASMPSGFVPSYGFPAISSPHFGRPHSRLSVEIEGHALGGGMLKLEPTEAGNVLLAYPEKSKMPRVLALAEELDDVVRRNGDEVAQTRANEMILRDMIGLSRRDCDMLTSAANELRGRRGYGDPTHGAA
jgi:hypothetical protein